MIDANDVLSVSNGGEHNCEVLGTDDNLARLIFLRMVIIELYIKSLKAQVITRTFMLLLVSFLSYLYQSFLSSFG